MMLDALRLKNQTGRPPIWLMRQAGRYLPEYRALRAQYDFMQMVKNPQLAAQVTVQPIQRFQFDAAILFSDILVLPDALGMGLQFKENVGPIFTNPLQLDLLKKDISTLAYVYETIGLIKERLSIPLIGFAGAPFTVASYMIEGGSSKALEKTKHWVFSKRDEFKKLMEILTEKTIEHLENQVKAGVDAVQLFDTWAGNLSHTHFKELSLPYIQRITEALGKKVPVLLFSKAATAFTDAFMESSPHGISFDINADLVKIRKKLPHIVIQGNLDPDVLLASPEVVRREARKILSAMQGDPGFIFNLGHGINPQTPLESVEALVDEVRRI